VRVHQWRVSFLLRQENVADAVLRFSASYRVYMTHHNKSMRTLQRTILLGSASCTRAFALAPIFAVGTLKNSIKTTEEIRAIHLEKETAARASHNNDVFNALFVSVPERPQPTPCRVPRDLKDLYPDCLTELPFDFPPGCLLRIGPNGGAPDDGFLDGDGMVQCVTLPPNDGTPAFTATYVHTKGRQREAEFKSGAGAPKYRGTLGAAPRGFPLLQRLAENAWTFKTLNAQKDTANTALAESGGRVLALMEQCPPCEISVAKDGRVETVEAMARLGGAIVFSDPLTGGSFSAHGRTDPETGERIHVSYNSIRSPYCRVDIFEEGWKLKRTIPVDISTCVMIHDCAITKHNIVIFDFPLTLRPTRMLVEDIFPVQYEPDHGARIGLVPREGGETRWFEVKPGVVLHAVNAFETSEGEVVVQALRSDPKTSSSYISVYSPSFLYEWRIDLKTEVVSEDYLNIDTMVEFPVVDERLNGGDAHHAYCVTVSSIGGPLMVYTAPGEGILIDGVVKFALQSSETQKKGDVLGKFTLPADWYAVSEPTVIPKKGKDGVYILMMATNVPTEATNRINIATKPNVLRSQLLVLDGDSLSSGPVYATETPFHVPYGLHSSFLDWEKMN
jgi:carotenoid cleavage dioxygenase-like enzyme